MQPVQPCSSGAEDPGVTSFQPPAVKSMQRTRRVARAYFKPAFLELEKPVLGKPAWWIAGAIEEQRDMLAAYREEDRLQNRRVLRGFLVPVRK